MCGCAVPESKPARPKVTQVDYADLQTGPQGTLWSRSMGMPIARNMASSRAPSPAARRPGANTELQATDSGEPTSSGNLDNAAVDRLCLQRRPLLDPGPTPHGPDGGCHPGMLALPRPSRSTHHRSASRRGNHLLYRLGREDSGVRQPVGGREGEGVDSRDAGNRRVAIQSGLRRDCSICLPCSLMCIARSRRRGGRHRSQQPVQLPRSWATGRPSSPISASVHTARINSALSPRPC